MRRLLTVAVVTLALAACKKPEAPKRPAAAGGAPAAQAAGGDRQILRGKVLEKIDVSQYSYLKLATASGEVWAAVTRTDKKAGDEVGVGNAFPMQNFESKELNRKFDVVYFGTLAAPGGEVAPMPPAMGGGAMGGGMPPPAMGEGAGGPPNPAQLAAQHQAVVTGPNDVEVKKVAKAAGADGRTIEEIWSQRAKLKGKPVAVRGQVVKFTAVMGKNFLHLRDGSGSPDSKTNDLTVTTSDAVGVGDVVTAKGVIVTDKDFGAGYAYPVIIEDAKVMK
ncbi:nucleotide-binding protein [Anaeromyxobacter diazotrophicus]|uniref:Nucleic acid binding OB-fold tRNA/helicase-type n=1 Tax=Anaeromyxobacter diazotrophicus TaxID=2590199 RepID=A0A7I9VGH1_9BACT|nr:nucleotide-binding protein [Anaeromyxobacter diazotrophicus]GEJ55349.1 hypothetical protein AMYX_00900 [Anaeromyxobacter diazotrophicus]